MLWMALRHYPFTDLGRRQSCAELEMSRMISRGRRGKTRTGCHTAAAATSDWWTNDASNDEQIDHQVLFAVWWCLMHRSLSKPFSTIQPSQRWENPTIPSNRNPRWVGLAGDPKDPSEIGSCDASEVRKRSPATKCAWHLVVFTMFLWFHLNIFKIWDADPN